MNFAFSFIIVFLTSMSKILRRNPQCDKSLYNEVPTIHNHIIDIVRPGQVSKGDMCSLVTIISRYFGSLLYRGFIQLNLLISVPDIQTRTDGD